MPNLILSREVDDSLTFVVPPSATEIVFVLTIFEIRRDRIRLSVQAPREVKIWRTELLAKGVQE